METLIITVIAVTIIWLTGWFRPVKSLSDTYVSKTQKLCDEIELDDVVKHTTKLNKIAKKIEALTEVNDVKSVKELLKAKLASKDN